MADKEPPRLDALNYVRFETAGLRLMQRPHSTRPLQNNSRILLKLEEGLRAVA